MMQYQEQYTHFEQPAAIETDYCATTAPTTYWSTDCEYGTQSLLSGQPLNLDCEVYSPEAYYQPLKTEDLSWWSNSSSSPQAASPLYLDLQYVGSPVDSSAATTPPMVTSPYSVMSSPYASSDNSSQRSPTAFGMDYYPSPVSPPYYYADQPQSSSDLLISPCSDSSCGCTTQHSYPYYNTAPDSVPVSPLAVAPQPTQQSKTTVPTAVSLAADARPYSCYLCSRAFARKHDLQRHIRVHTGAKPYACLCCKKAFARTDALKRHLRMEESCRTSPEIQAMKFAGKRRYRNL